MSINFNNSINNKTSYNFEVEAKPQIYNYNNKNLTTTPTIQRTFQFYSSNSKNQVIHNFSESQNKNINNNYSKSIYSPFVIKKSSEHLNSNQNNNINFYNGNINNNIFNKNHFSPESQNTLPNHKIYTPSPNNIKNERLSDRFIPMNKGMNLLEKFELTKTWDMKTQNDTLNFNSPNAKKEEEEKKADQNSLYHNLLQNNFFGFDQNFDDPILKSLGKNSMDLEGYNKSDSSSKASVKSKIFKFKTEKKKKSSINVNLGNIFESMQNSSNINNVNYSRKISNRPYKIIEAPGLMDDFYLNLLDWSSKNEIAVGLDNSVYLYCASKTQTINLFTYEQEKYVSSLIWNQSGTELAVGNSEGIVEIWDGNNTYKFIIHLIIFLKDGKFTMSHSKFLFVNFLLFY